MSFWLPSSARWSLDPGLRREDENEFPPRFLFVSPAKAGAQGPRWGSPLPRRTSAQQAVRRHNARVLLKETAASVPRRPRWPAVLLVATQCTVAPGLNRPGFSGVSIT